MALGRSVNHFVAFPHFFHGLLNTTMLFNQVLSREERGDGADELDIRVLHIDRVRVNLIVLLWLFSFYLDIRFQSILFFLVVEGIVRQNFLDRLIELPIVFPPLLFDLSEAVLHLVIRLLYRTVNPHREPLDHNFGVGFDQVAALVLYLLAASVKVHQNDVVELVCFRGPVSFSGHLQLFLPDQKVLEHFLVTVSLAFECKLLKALL